jgi:N-acyl-D-amino-acid deacylase
MEPRPLILARLSKQKRGRRKDMPVFARKIFLILMVGLLMFMPAAGWAQGTAEADVLIRNGTIYDGSGKPARRADLLIRGDRIVGVGRVGSYDRRRVKTVIDARGLAVAPGFINMLSWAVDDLLVDGRSMGDLLQGVTTEIFGEGTSMGPLNEEMKQRQLAAQGDVRFPIEWTTLAEYLRHLEKSGVSCNVASFIGATTIREHVIGLEDRPPTPAQLEQMRQLVRREMEEGALGIGSSLIYAPAFYASTEELIELCKVAAEYKGKYISHRAVAHCP